LWSKEKTFNREKHEGHEAGLLIIQNVCALRGETFSRGIVSTGMRVGDFARLAIIFNYHKETID
jgi:hypothetical protein